MKGVWMEQTSAKYGAGEQSGGISGNTLKMVAIVTMLIDHIGAGIVEPYLNMNMVVMEGNELLSRLYYLDIGLRIIGRAAFPIFCFLLVEGFLHTHNVKKYGSRLLLFSLISEIPFDLAFFGTWFYPAYQNVYITLFIGLVVLVGYRRWEYDAVKKMLVVAAGCAAAYLLRCDYDISGILMIVILYEFRRNKRYQVLAGGLMAALESISFFGAAVLAFIPISMYNGTRGRINLKYFFYWFYPVHIMVLYLIQLLVVR